MTFEYPVWLYATVVIVLIIAGLLGFGMRHRDTLLAKFASTRLLGKLTEKASKKRAMIKAICVLLGLAAIGIALARPQYGVEWSERKARGLDIVFVLDSSKSMLATDIRPTRLDRAKLAVLDLTERLKSDRVGLVAFAGRAFLQTPPTLDYSAFRESLESISPGTMTSGGSDIGNAIREAEKAFPEGNNFKVMILLTDGEDLGGNAITSTKEAAKSGIKVYAIGIGTPEGEYLKVRKGQGEEVFVRDPDGEPVRSQLDEATLQEIAQLTGGSYSRLNRQSLETLYNSVIATLPREERQAELQERPIERFQWLIGFAILALVSEIFIRSRSNPKSHMALTVLAALPFLPNPSQAQESIEEALFAVAEAEAEAAALLEDPVALFNQAYKALQADELESAKDLYVNSIAKSEDFELQRDALYNLGHGSYQAGSQAYETGDLDLAIEQMLESESFFNSAQEIDPNDTAAAEDLEKVKAVREAIEKLKQEQENNKDQQEQQERNEQEQNQDQKESGDNQENQDSQDSESEENQQSESSEQEESEQGQDPDQQNGESSEQQENQNSASSQNSGSDQNSENTDESDQEESFEGGQDEEQESGESSGDESEPEEEGSTRNPAEDMAHEAEEGDELGEQPEAGAEASEQDDGGSGQSVQDASKEEGETSEEETNGTQAVQIEGMTEEDARALLDSLRTGEKLLPFVDQKAPRNHGLRKDW